jgi:hypothetical protein
MLISFALIGLLFILSVALITPPAASRALPVRGYLTAVWLLTGVVAAIWSWAEKFQPPVIVWHIISNCIFAIAIFVAVSERDRDGRRVLRTIPQHWLKRQLAFLYYSGAASGLAWSCAMIGLTLNAAWAWVSLTVSFKEAHDLTESLKWIGGMCLYFYCYALSAASLRRHLFVWLGTELTWLLGVTLMALGSILPFLYGYLFLFSDQWWSKDIGVWLVGNPFAFSNDTHRELYVIVGSLWAALVTALNLHWFIARVRSFHPATNNAEPEEIIELGLS